MDARLLDMLGQIAKGIAAQFGPNCEVVVHEISDKSAYSSIVAIENGHVSGRKIGDGPSHVVLEQIGHDDDQVSDQLCYLTRTKDGKTLKSSSVYIHDEHLIFLYQSYPLPVDSVCLFSSVCRISSN